MYPICAKTMHKSYATRVAKDYMLTKSKRLQDTKTIKVHATKVVEQNIHYHNYR